MLDAPACVRVAALVRHEARLLARAPGPLIGYTIVPLVLMSVLRPMLELLTAAGPPAEWRGTAQAATGMAVMFSLFAVKVVGAGFLDEHTWHTWDRLRASPASGREILAGKALPMLGVLIVQQSIVLGVATIAFGLRPAVSWWPLACTVVVWSACILVIGMTAATLVRSPAQLSVGGDILAVLTSILGGALVPLTLLPAALQWVAPASPGYWAMRAYRAALVGAPTFGPLAILLAFFALGVVASSLFLRRGRASV
jgi:ABC-2 type transport system permease protein